MDRLCQDCYGGLPRHCGFQTLVGMRKLERGPEIPLGDQLFMRKLEGRMAMRTVCLGQRSP